MGRVGGGSVRDSCLGRILGPGWSGMRAVSVVVALLFALCVPAQGLAGDGKPPPATSGLRQYVEGVSKSRGGSGMNAPPPGAPCRR